MGTRALVELADPTGGQSVSFRVHYDGGAATGEELRQLIARDGYTSVYTTFACQPSRFWVALNSGLESTPGYVGDYPASWDVALVAGYGLLFVGAQERELSSDPACFDPKCWEEIRWAVSASGNVTGGFAGR